MTKEQGLDCRLSSQGQVQVLFCNANNSFYDVIDVGEISFHIAMIVNIDSLWGQYIASEKEWRHIRTIYGEKPKARGWDLYKCE